MCPSASSLGKKRAVRESDHSPLFKRADTDNEHSYNSTPSYASRITQGYLYVYLYYVVLRNKDMPYCFLAITAQQYIPAADSIKNRMYVSRCDGNEKDVEFRVIMALLPYTLQPRRQQLKLEVKRNFARYGRRPAKEKLFFPIKRRLYSSHIS